MNIFKKLKEGLAKTRQNIVAGFDSIFSGHKAINDDFYDELEEVMIMGDMGVRATDEILEELKAKVKEQKIKDPEECRQLLIDTIKEKIDLGPNAYDYENTRSALLIIGVNGVGKTTSVGKLAASLKSKGKKVVLAAADTFRAGAIDQLKVWGKRAGVDVVAQQEGADPGAVIFDAVQASKARGADVLIADTAGRLHNKKNLMNELSKIDRIIEREYPDCYRENLIVLDATTGQNAISQLKEFNEVTDITGIILTKMDGTAKGGIIIAIQAEFGIPVKYIGVGEKIEDLQKFDSGSFVNALFDVELSDEEMRGFEEDEIDETLLASDAYDDIFAGGADVEEDIAEEEYLSETEPVEEEEPEYEAEPEVSEEAKYEEEPEATEEPEYEAEPDVTEEAKYEEEPEYEAEPEITEQPEKVDDAVAAEESVDTDESVTEEESEEGEAPVSENVGEIGGIFEDISDDEDELYDEDEDEDDEEEISTVHNDKAYEAFMRKRRLAHDWEDEDDGSDLNDDSSDEADEDYGDDGYQDEKYDDHDTGKRRGLFGLFRRRK